MKYPATLADQARDFIRIRSDLSPRDAKEVVIELTALLESIMRQERERCAIVCDRIMAERADLRLAAIRQGDRDAATMHAAKGFEADRCASAIRDDVR